jgi:hypothetical protein
VRAQIPLPGGTCFAKAPLYDNSDCQPDEDDMRIHDQRVLRDFGMDKCEWAVLFAASYYEPIPWRRFLELAAWESNGEVTEAEISEALTRCIDKNWVLLSHDVPALFASDEPEETVVLTELGYQLKNSVFVAMMEERVNDASAA